MIETTKERIYRINMLGFKISISIENMAKLENYEKLIKPILEKQIATKALAALEGGEDE
ncbi:hypothetical protein P7266_1768 [Lactococcus cremoris]|nr:hypothetical protein P7266_1768 [Lactococcus cremoris]